MERVTRVAVSVIVVFAVMLCSACIKVNAVTPVVSLEGEKEVESGELQTVSIKVVNENGIGVIQGKVSGDSNIEIVNVEAKDNKWTVNYNSKTKQFDGYCAEGVKSAEIINIKYKLKENAKQGTIEVSDVILTTLTYNTLNEGKFEKVVTAKATSGNNNKKPQNGEVKYPENVPQNNGNEEIIVTNNTNNVKDKNNNSSNGIIPKLGQSGVMLICVIASVLFAAVSHKRLKNKRK